MLLKMDRSQKLNSIYDKKNYLMNIKPVFFAIGITLLIPMFFAGIWFSRNDYLVLQEVTQCIIKDKTSIPCPGCGGTRACCLLFQGHLIASFFMHPSVLIGDIKLLK